MAMPAKKSPRAPSISLEEAIARSTKIYDKERRNAAPTDVIAQDLGYKSANNGAALAVIASLRYYGLLERPRDGYMAASKDLETYLYAPNDSIKATLLQKWLRTPSVFEELITKFEQGLPSDATLRFDLIQQGFSPASAETLLSVFKQSVDFVERTTGASPFLKLDVAGEEASSEVPPAPTNATPIARVESPNIPYVAQDAESDRIPIRLSGNRRAWLVIPSPFYASDKERLKAQIDLLLTDDDSG